MCWWVDVMRAMRQFPKSQFMFKGRAKRDMLTIREEQPADVEAIREINLAAFDGPAEADIIDALRRDCDDLLSLVAVDDGRVVGHILFSPVTIDGAVVGMGLAPVAVAPDRRRQGIGSDLVRRGVEILRDRRCPCIIVLGHPEFYPRFGFEPASTYDLQCQWPGVPDDVFMVLPLDASVVADMQGVVRYRGEFDAAM